MRDARTACAFELSSSAALPLLMTKPSAPAIKATAPTHIKWAGAVAGWTGLEPATSAVTGRRSNQLSYHPLLCSGRAELSEDPRRWQSLFCENNHFS